MSREVRRKLVTISRRGFGHVVVRLKHFRHWVRPAAPYLIAAAVILSGLSGYACVSMSRRIDALLSDERTQSTPRVYARPFELKRGQSLTDRQLIDRLNDLGYTHRPRVEQPGEFAIGQDAVALVVRGGQRNGQVVRVILRQQKGPPPSGTVSGLEVVGKGRINSLELETPLISEIVGSDREKRRREPLTRMPRQLVDAVLAIEDRRFYDHPGVDVIRTIGAAITNLRGDRPYLVGGSTLTQQLVKNYFLTPEKTLRRKIQEQFMALLVERRLTKPEILELYLNEVYLGQRGSFAIHGVPEAARLFFGKAVTNVSLAESATIAGIIQSPQTYSPFRSPDRARARRNTVLSAMVDADLLSPEAAKRASEEPLITTPTALEAEAPYFVDLVGQIVSETYPGAASGHHLEVHSTLDLHLQRIAQDAVREGLSRVDATLARRKSAGPAPPQAALVAVDPRSGDILALVGGRSYNQSQFNRAVSARRQPGSVAKPFVFLAAFERARTDGRSNLTPATLVDDEPTTFLDRDQEWTPGNYGDEYDGRISFRHALAHSRNVATIKAAEMTGYDRVAALWRKLGTSTAPKAYPSVALGVFEATPLEIAEAYTIFPNGGTTRPLRTVVQLMADGQELAPPPPSQAHPVAHPATTYLVTSMMRSVLTEGTGASARALGFVLDAAGKSGTTNDLRDAWFVGFTPELLTVVWVGFDDNRPLGLSGTQAALPIWASFMSRALGGHPNIPFEMPPDVTLVDIDPDTGQLAGPACPRVLSETFLAGTAPVERCTLHQY